MLTLATLLLIVGGTLIAEDATAIGVGLATAEGRLPLAPALGACVAGIFLGDVALWAVGRIAGRRLIESPRLRRFVPTAAASLGTWVDRHPALAIVGSRFTPGARLPLYVSAGIWGTRPWRFLFWMLVAVSLWTPLLVVGAGVAGLQTGPLATWLRGGWLSRLTAIVALVALVRTALTLATAEGRARAAVRVARLRRWEFWPAWTLYGPLTPWLIWLALRHRGPTVFTAANPGIEHGGVVGESKHAILSALPARWVLPWAFIEPGPIGARLHRLRAGIAALGGAYPFVLKPDVGERGAGVKWIRCEADAIAHLEREPRALVLQVAHDGPYEAGLFYVRHPDEAHGRVFSVTDKRFPWIVGDGRSTLETLVRAHPRYRLQGDVFLARHAAQADRVLGAGERVQLARAGNHAQGTEFRDGRALLTPALEARIDEIARATPGFYFGRFDVRYRDRAAFMAGTDLAIVELNGVTSEATHIYDPAVGTLWSAWTTLARQWSWAFAVGAANRARGHQPTPALELARLIWQQGRGRAGRALAD
jgi:membrane protein DedA with SNARE-associated domain